MLHANVVIAVCLGYVAILFGVAFAGDRRARRDPGGWLRLAARLHAVDLDLLHVLDLLRRGRLGGAQRARVRDDLPRARPWSSSAGGCCCASSCASGASTTSPRSPT